MDTDNDGELSLDEFVLFMHICENSKPDDHARILFLAADTDYSGMIDIDELKVVTQKLGYEVDDQDLRDLMDDYGCKG